MFNPYISFSKHFSFLGIHFEFILNHEQECVFIPSWFLCLLKSKKQFIKTVLIIKCKLTLILLYFTLSRGCCWCCVPWQEVHRRRIALQHIMYSFSLRISEVVQKWTDHRPPFFGIFGYRGKTGSVSNFNEFECPKRRMETQGII